LAISTDSEATQAKFRRAIGAPFGFISDADGRLAKLYGIKTPLLTVARRFTFVVGKDRRVLHVESGSAAVAGAGAAEACSLY
jgi:thioredoxin-dependent peroxiredoxin